MYGIQFVCIITKYQTFCIQICNEIAILIKQRSKINNFVIIFIIILCVEFITKTVIIFAFI